MLLAINTTNPERTSVILMSLNCHSGTPKGYPESKRRRSRVTPTTALRGVGKPGMTGSGDSYKVTEFKTWFAGENQSEELLPEIDRILKKRKLCLKDLKLIIVCKGPGSFTGTRVGISVVNAFAYSLKISVIGVKEGQFNEKKFKEIAKDFNKYKEKIVTPYYSKKPNITNPSNL